jgi:ribonuclease P protein component
MAREGGLMVEEAPREAHIPAQQSPQGQEAWLPVPDVHQGRPQRPSVPSAQGPSTAVGLIWRLRDRRTFVELRRRGRRARHGVVAVTMLAPSASTVADPPRVAFAVPRKVGTAVVRNRVRRQVRAHLGSVRAADPVRLSGGSWLFALLPGVAEVDRTVLLADVDACLDRLTGEAR